MSKNVKSNLGLQRKIDQWDQLKKKNGEYVCECVYIFASLSELKCVYYMRYRSDIFYVLL